MVSVYESRKVKDIITTMPEQVITNILDHLPIQDAVKTSALSRKWRFRWTMVTRLVFDIKFYEYLLTTKGKLLFYSRDISTILLQLTGFVTKFVLYIPKDVHKVVYTEGINHWILFLSKKRVQEFILINMHKTPLKLSTHLFSCLELKHLMLRNCHFRHGLGFQGFPNLLSFDFQWVTFGSYKFGEFIRRCPLLESLNLKVNHDIWVGKVKPFEITKLVNLKTLSLLLSKLDTVSITSLDIISLLGYLPKLQELHLDFYKCKFLGDSGGRKRMPAAMLCLKTFALYGMDFNNCSMVICACDLIRSSPNLQTLKITGTPEGSLSPSPLSLWEVDCGAIGKLQIVELEGIRGSEIEMCLIKSLLAYSSSLKKMIIKQRAVGDVNNNYTFARKLLEFRRASPFVGIDLS